MAEQREVTLDVWGSGPSTRQCGIIGIHTTRALVVAMSTNDRHSHGLCIAGYGCLAGDNDRWV